MALAFYNEGIPIYDLQPKTSSIFRTQPYYKMGTS